MRRWIVWLGWCMIWCCCFSHRLVAADHAENALYRKLVKSGIQIGDQSFTLPEPYLADGLSPAEQRQVVEKLPGRHQEVEEMLGLSPVAPFAVKFQDIPTGLADYPAKRIDLAFVTPGTLDKLARTDVLDRLLNSGRTDAQITPLGEQAQATENRGQAHVALSLMDRVLLEGTMQTMWTRNSHSLILAGQLDPQFTSHAQYPNRWRLLQRDAEGKLQPLPASQAYEAVGYYFKFTTLAGMEDALLVEAHLLFAEPAAWFDGANLLRSKLPMVLQTKIRAFRRDLMRP